MKKFIFIAALAATTAHAEFYTGNQLLTQMNGTNMEQMHALGYVVGVTDVWTGVRICPPSGSGGITAGQAADVVKQYLNANPQWRHQTADALVLNAMSAAWPCSGSGNRSGGSKTL